MAKYLTIKYGPLGKLKWSRVFNIGDTDKASDIVLDATGNVYVTGSAGYTFSPRPTQQLTDSDYGTLKYDPNGVLLWSRFYEDGADGKTADGNSITLDNSGNVFVTGRSQEPGTEFDFVTVKYTP